MRLPAIPDRLAAALAVLGGIAWAAAGPLQLFVGDAAQDRVDTPVLHAELALFSVALLLTAPAMLVLGRRIAWRWPGPAAAAGMVALAAAGAASNVHGRDYGWFVVVAPVANLLWLGGTVALAIGLSRARAVPRLAAWMLPVAWVTALPLNQFGGSIVTGAYWIAMGALIGGVVATRTPAPARAS